MFKGRVFTKPSYLCGLQNWRLCWDRWFRTSLRCVTSHAPEPGQPWSTSPTFLHFRLRTLVQCAQPRGRRRTHRLLGLTISAHGAGRLSPGTGAAGWVVGGRAGPSRHRPPRRARPARVGTALAKGNLKWPNMEAAEGAGRLRGAEASGTARGMRCSVGRSARAISGLPWEPSWPKSSALAPASGAVPGERGRPAPTRPPRQLGVARNLATRRPPRESAVGLGPLGPSASAPPSAHATSAPRPRPQSSIHRAEPRARSRAPSASRVGRWPWSLRATVLDAARE